MKRSGDALAPKLLTRGCHCNEPEQPPESEILDACQHGPSASQARTKASRRLKAIR